MAARKAPTPVPVGTVKPAPPPAPPPKRVDLYPMHEKLEGLGHDRAAVQNFIDWLFDEKEWWICEHRPRLRDDGFTPIRQRREDIMADFFGIDLTILDDEKRAMLDRQREINQRADRERRASK